MTNVTPSDEIPIPVVPLTPEDSEGLAAPGAPGGPAIPASGLAGRKRKAGLGTWALVLGIVGILFALVPHTSGFGIFLAVIALILGGIGLLLKGGRALAGTVLGGIALILGIIFLSVYGSLPSSSLAGSSAGTESSNSVAAPGKPAAPVKPVVPAGTAAELQALAAAQGYLSDGQGFSEAGLLSQLTSTYGDGFAQTDAQWAIDHSTPDWNAQALAAAKGYLSDGQGFSQAGLTAQLTLPSGDQFTQAQAEYGVAQSGADWNAQAVASAKGYMSDGEGFSRASLIEQLTSSFGEQFTEAQAEYAAGQVGLN
jgi:Host cell surface-exposed lipoprotein